jgi:hypothetical protein
MPHLQAPFGCLRGRTGPREGECWQGNPAASEKHPLYKQRNVRDVGYVRECADGPWPRHPRSSSPFGCQLCRFFGCPEPSPWCALLLGLGPALPRAPRVCRGARRCSARHSPGVGVRQVSPAVVGRAPVRASPDLAPRAPRVRRGLDLALVVLRLLRLACALARARRSVAARCLGRGIRRARGRRLSSAARCGGERGAGARSVVAERRGSGRRASRRAARRRASAYPWEALAAGVARRARCAGRCVAGRRRPRAGRAASHRGAEW